MKIKSLLLFVGVFVFDNISAQSDTLKLNKSRVLIAGTTTATAIGLSYWYVQNSWWSDKKVSFHFDNGADLKYALNVDKAGHFMGGLQAADFFSSSMRWSGMEHKKSLYYGAFFGSGLQLAIEIKDAYAPYWGFSSWDLALGTAGAVWPILQYQNPNLRSINFKFSYYKRSQIYWQLEKQRGKTPSQYAWQDDYPNQTYWMTFPLNNFSKNIFFPEWLNIAVGFGLDESQYLDENLSKKGGQNEWYIALDYDIPTLLKKWNTPTGKTIKNWLNYIHLPAPTIRISPKVEFYPVFL